MRAVSGDETRIFCVDSKALVSQITTLDNHGEQKGTAHNVLHAEP